MTTIAFPLGKFLVVTFTIGILSTKETAASKILSVTFASSKSHKIIYEPLLLELARRGHKITILTPIKSSPDHANIEEVIGISEDEAKDEEGLAFDVFKMKEDKVELNPFTFMVPFMEKFCTRLFTLPHVQKIINGKYDLVITSGFLNECILGVLPHVKAPSILILPFTAPFWTVGPVTGGPSPPSFVPFVFFGYGDHMDFFQRLKNFVGIVSMTGIFNYYYYPKMEAVYKGHFGPNSQSVDEILRNVSLVLSNSHFSLNFPRPLMPDVIEIGGMHCRPSKQLPKELDDFLSGSGQDGFIYFSMGSVVQAKMMPEKYRKQLVNVFSKLKQRVLWKWEEDEMEDLPRNVKLSKWVPQQDVLGHPKIRLFITHGGLLSTEEAVYHGVPLLGFPMYGDQHSNMEHAERLGFAQSRDFVSVTEDELLKSINEMLSNSLYKEKVKTLSTLFRDRPQEPLDLAVFWTEYIIRHKGALHLRSAARDLNFFQYYSLDVIGVLFVCISTMMYIIFAAIKFISRKICRSRLSNASQNKLGGRRHKYD